MTNQKQRERRRKLVIDREVETRIVYRITWVPLACLLFASVALAFVCEEARTSAAAVGVQAPGIIQAFLCAELLIMLCGGFLLRNALVVSNRLAGPQYRFRQTFKAFMEKFPDDPRGAEARRRLAQPAGSAPSSSEPSAAAFSVEALVG